MGRIGLIRLVDLGPGAEFDAIRTFVAAEGFWPTAVRVGPGDDATVFGDGWCLSTDVSVEDVHFRRAWLSDAEIGYRAAAAALSDLAAMGAECVGALVSVAAPEDVDLAAVQAGVREACAEHDGRVLGGDLSRSPAGLVIDVTVLGRAEWPVLRAGAEPGDEVWVTGELGGAAAAVAVWESGGAPTDALRAVFARPRPRLHASCCLVEEGRPSAMIDLSDGLAGDVGHLAAASGVRIDLEPDRVPVCPAAVESLGAERALECALHGGEDFELAFTAAPGDVDPAGFQERFGVRLTRVGTVREGAGVWRLEPEGKARPMARGGHDHLAGAP